MAGLCHFSFLRMEYPKPGPMGGTLIRRVLALLDQFEARPSLDSHILIALSGGPDSVALARLLTRYGRKIAGEGKVRLIHFNHGWPKPETDDDAEWVQRLAESWGLPLDLGQGVPDLKNGESLEAQARTQRKAFYSEILARYPGSWVLTGHHADDLAETVLWRILSGAREHSWGGIQVRNAQDRELRPFLTTRKAELLEFLKEEGLGWREDAANRNPRFLRNRMRARLMPEVSALFPAAVETLAELALARQHPNELSSLPEAKTNERSRPSAAQFIDV